MSFMSTTQIAQAAGVSPRTIFAQAAKRGIRPLGLLGRTKLWSLAVSERLKSGSARRHP